MKPAAILTTALLASLSMPAMANKSQSSIAAGFVFTEVGSGGFEDYFGDLYNNEDLSKSMFGAYVNGQYSFDNPLFISASMEGVTRSSTSLESMDVQLGVALPLAANIEGYLTGGVDWVRPIRRTSNVDGEGNFGYHKPYDHGAVAEAGVHIDVNSVWSVNPAYSYSDVFDNGIHKAKIHNTFNIRGGFGIQASYEYVFSKNLGQSNFKGGVIYAF
ncbi:porin family protein [Vibrio sp. ZSDE26]|uniref:Porin family protein n=1 Tax=Vibrio amylolyticus TaxID=2847292 RepID=A0A9X2BJI3_9VIBR|nr:porin family protein [Vibrio amylolyticus]MCK6263497.1 porin family protein [Vibrio amylolyticus]